MILVPCKIEDIKKRKTYTDLYKILTEFLEGEADCVKVENYKHKNAYVCRETLYRSAQRYYKNQIKIIQRGDDAYLVKTIAIK